MKTASCTIPGRGSCPNPRSTAGRQGPGRWAGTVPLALSAHKPAGFASPAPPHGWWRRAHRLAFTAGAAAPSVLAGGVLLSPLRPAVPLTATGTSACPSAARPAPSRPRARYLPWLLLSSLGCGGASVRRERHGGGDRLLLLFFLLLLGAAPGLGAAEAMASPLATGAPGRLRHQQLSSQRRQVRHAAPLGVSSSSLLPSSSSSSRCGGEPCGERRDEGGRRARARLPARRPPFNGRAGRFASARRPERAPDRLREGDGTAARCRETPLLPRSPPAGGSCPWSPAEWQFSPGTWASEGVCGSGQGSWILWRFNRCAEMGEPLKCGLPSRLLPEGSAASQHLFAPAAVKSLSVRLHAIAMCLKFFWASVVIFGDGL